MLTPTTLFKCLGDDTRLRCVTLLHQEGRLCVCDLTEALDMLQPKISRHLALLRQCAVLIDTREGQWVYYQINPDLPIWAADIVAIAVGQFSQDPTAQQDHQRLQAMLNYSVPVRCC
ncbi:MAG: metalloregulator ArsR/SmtB family transcription factor [Methylovulum sp.]|nr:metalloregulator ArsR/SmtB family transcription factor [Methylovulum sp.]